MIIKKKKIYFLRIRLFTCIICQLQVMNRRNECLLFFFKDRFHWISHMNNITATTKKRQKKKEVLIDSIKFFLCYLFRFMNGLANKILLIIFKINIFEMSLFKKSLKFFFTFVSFLTWKKVENSVCFSFNFII